MILPIIAFGDPILKKKAEKIEASYPKIKELINNMYETMYNASGVGLAAPQIGLSIRLFITDGSPFAEVEEGEVIDPKAIGMENFKKVFINPEILKEEGEEWSFAEGCLSIPKIREEVLRKEKILIRYYNEEFALCEEEFDGYSARIIQHEYDHLNGVLFTDYLSGLKRKLLSKKLLSISKGDIKVDYKMKFPILKKK
ncbi:MAG: peptide deformylase [Flavobacteriia bacterium]|nr:peptide deformylase [Flavobacteriia bacterium]